MDRVTLYYASMFVFGALFGGRGLYSGLTAGFSLPVALMAVGGVGMAAATVYQATTMDDPEVSQLVVGATTLGALLAVTGTVLSVLG